MKDNELTIGVSYNRVSTQEQAERGFSLEAQKESCIKTANNLNVRLIKNFTDEGESAKTDDRAGLQEMLKFCSDKKNGVKCLIVYKIDRLTRNSRDYNNIIYLLQRLGIKLISTTEAVGETSFGKFIGNMMASISQLDNDVRSERVTEGIRKCIESGRLPGKSPAGYINYIDPLGNKSVLIDPKNGPIIKLALEEFSKGIYMEEDIRRLLIKHGYKTKKGNDPNSQFVSKLLRKKFYIGIIESKGSEFPGTHEKLISEETFYKNQSILKRLRGGSAPMQSTNESFPLRHNVRCLYCTRPLTAAFSKGKSGAKFPYYRCYNAKCGSKKSISKDKLEGEFCDYIRDITPKKGPMNAFKAVIIDTWQKQYKELGKNREKIQNELSRLDMDKDKILEMAKKELLSDEDFKDEFRKIKNAVAEKQALLAETRVENFNIDEAVTFVFDFITAIPARWKDATYAEQIMIQSLIFPEKPFYKYPGFETPKISCLYEPKEALSASYNSDVVPRGIEPLFHP